MAHGSFGHIVIKKASDFAEVHHMDGVTESPETPTLSEGHQLLLDLLKEKHELADDRSFAMWLRVPLMRSKQRWVLAATAVIAVVVALLVLVAGVPTWAFAVPAVGLLAVFAFTERDVLSLGSDGPRLHKPVDSKLDEGTVVAFERQGGRVVVDGVDYRADSLALDTVERLLAA